SGPPETARTIPHELASAANNAAASNPASAASATCLVIHAAQNGGGGLRIFLLHFPQGGASRILLTKRGERHAEFQKRIRPLRTLFPSPVDIQERVCCVTILALLVVAFA